MTPRSTATDRPAVSVIIPAYNEQTFLGRCLDSLARQSYPADRIEVVVLDNGSTDATPEIARSRGVRLEIDPVSRVGGLRNRGAALATGEVLAFLDADCVAPPDWIASAVDALDSDPSLGAVGGNYLVEDGASWIEKVWALRPVTGPARVSYLATGDMAYKQPPTT